MQHDPVETVLESVLNSYQVRVEIITSVRYCGDWVDREPNTPRGQFHLIEEGRCLVDGAMFKAPVILNRGDFIVFPRGSAHVLTACLEPGSAAGPCEDTTMLCGELEFVSGSRNPIFAALPSYFVVQADSGGDMFRSLAAMLTSISSAGQVGHRVIENKIADSLFTMAVVDYARRASRLDGIFAALSDSRIARALSAIHARPGEDWTVQALADVAAMSRTAFTGKFAELMGMPPIQYLSHWRVTEAQRLLRDRTVSVASIAESLGYNSESAFRRLFKRIAGIGPGKVRAVGVQASARLQ